MKLLRTTALCMLAAFGATPALADVSVGEIDVRTELADFENSNALDYWTDLDKDLSAAIAEIVEVTGESEDDKLLVSINSIMLDGSPMLPETGEFNQLEGTIAYFEGSEVGGNSENTDASQSPQQSYSLQMSAVAEDSTVPEGWIVISPSKDDYYNALVNAFAMEVVNNIEQ